MSSAERFLDSILDSPDDVSPNLILADWLEEQGDPHGEFVRVQSTLAEWISDLDRRTPLLRRQEELLAQHEHDWLAPLAGLKMRRHWHAGLLHASIAATDLAELDQNAWRDWFREALVHTVRIEGLSMLPPRDYSFPTSLEGVRSFDLSGQGLTDSDLHDLLGCSWFTQARQLDLSNNQLSSGCLQRLCMSSLMGQLSRLDIRNNQFDDVGVQTLTGWPTARRLRRLDVSGNPISVQAQRIALEWCQARGTFRDRFLNEFGMEFVRIPAGTFLMGSPESEPQRFTDEGPQHVVTISRPFFLGVHPVTQRQFEQVMGRNPSSFTNVEMHGSHPVDSVSWVDAVEFCRLLSTADRTYRLPSEAEWEHACRAGTDTPFPHPHHHSFSSHFANFDGGRPYGDAEVGPDLQRTTPVGSYPPGAFGLFDMQGNTWEWCRDCRDGSDYTADAVVDPVVVTDTTSRICRGGSWASPGHYLRCADRGSDHMNVRQHYYGFRVACNAD